MTNPTRTKRKKKSIDLGRRVMKFPGIKGKTLEEVDFSTYADDHSITLFFRDKTALHFDIEPSFTVFAKYASLKTGEWRPIKSWRPVRSQVPRD